MFLINVPVALVGFVAAAAILPEFRSPVNRGFDVTGVVASVVGLVAVTYGSIRAGVNGWGNPGALILIVAGIAILAGFLSWERRLTEQPGGHPLIDMTLFDSASFTWGSIFAAMSFLALIGVLFTMPQYFQGVLGTTPMGSGLRLLPLVAGILIGALPAAQVARLVGSKLAVAGGFGLLAAGLLVGATTGVDSSEIFVAGWLVVVGAGMGVALAASTSAALVELTPEDSGVGSGVLEAIDEVGGPLGIAVLGSVVGLGYVADLAIRVCRVHWQPPRVKVSSVVSQWHKSSVHQRCSQRFTLPLSTACVWPSWSQHQSPSWQEASPSGSFRGRMRH